MEEISVLVEKDDVEFDRRPVKEDQRPYQENFYRKLTSFDVEQALFPLIYYDNVNGKPRKSKELMLSDEQEDSTSVPLECCRLRRLDQRFRIALPLARRSQSPFSKHPSIVLCSNCQILKNKQVKEMEKRFDTESRQRQIEINLISEEEKRCLFERSSNSSTSEMLVWKVDPLQSLISSYDTGSLTENERKKLIIETIEKLQGILSNQSSMHHQMGTQLTNEALETSIRILQSSIDLNQRFIS